MRRFLYTCAANICLGLGVASLFVPLLPATLLMLMAAYFYVMGSARWARWAHRHPRCVQILKRCRYHAVIRPACVLISVCFVLLWYSIPLLCRSLGWGLKLLAAWWGILIAEFSTSGFRAHRSERGLATGRNTRRMQTATAVLVRYSGVG